MSIDIQVTCPEAEGEPFEVAKEVENFLKEKGFQFTAKFVHGTGGRAGNGYWKGWHFLVEPKE